MTVKFFGSVQSTRVQRVILVCNEIGIHYELNEISMAKGEHKAPEYIQKYHPFGLLPAIEDNGLKLFESRAICHYLVSRYGKGKSTLESEKGSPAEMGKYEQTASVEYSYFDPSMSTLAYEKMFKKFMGKGDPDPAVVDHVLGILRVCLDYYEETLSSQAYLSGENFGLIDLYHIPWFPFFRTLGIEEEISRRPAVMQWWGKVSSRSSWRDLLELMPNQ